MTREELQRLYDRWVECSDVTRVPWSGAEYTESMRAVLAGVGDFLAEPDPTVEIAYLKAKLADVEAENRVPGMLSMKWDGGRCAVLDADQRIVGYLSPGRQSAGAAASALREAADGWSDWDALAAPEDWLRERADRIESGDQHA